MKYLRHSPLAIWIVVVALLGLLLFGALSVGQSTKPADLYSAALSPADVASVKALSGDLGTLEVALGTKASLRPVATAIATTASSAAASRAKRDGNDALVMDLRAVANSARQMGSLPANASTSQRFGAALVVGTSVDRVLQDTTNPGMGVG